MAQRVDTAYFTVYVFDEEVPVLDCGGPTLDLCTYEFTTAERPVNPAGKHEGTATGRHAHGNYANYQYIYITAGGAGTVEDPSPTVWPTEVRDNVNSNAMFSASARDTTGARSWAEIAGRRVSHPPPGYTAEAWTAQTPYGGHPSITGAIAADGMTPGMETGCQGGAMDHCGFWRGIPGAGCDARSDHYGVARCGHPPPTQHGLYSD